MIIYKHGNILKEDAEALINTVNCVGVMGRGIALQFKNAYPKNFKAYQKACKNNEVQPGKMFVYETGSLVNPRYIINFPTKRHWKGKSHLEDIESGLQSLFELIKRLNIQSIAIPPLGSGLGGLDWSIVKPLIEEKLKSLSDVNTIIYEPNGTPDKVQKPKVPNMTPGRAALVGLINNYLKGLLDPFVTLLEVHKLMYFMQEAGEPLKLEYKKAIYGPYAENLRHVLNAIEGHFIKGYSAGGDNPGKQLELVPGVIDTASHFLEQHQDTLERFKKVSDLVDSFESPSGLELLATVHWVMKHEQCPSDEDLIRHTYAWNKRKKQFTERQIILARDVLINKRWVERKLERDRI